MKGISTCVAHLLTEVCVHLKTPRTSLGRLCRPHVLFGSEREAALLGLCSVGDGWTGEREAIVE
jgi:hypothetical protein